MYPIRRYYRLIHILANYWLKKSTLPHMPIKLWIESTNHCNLRCVMCPNRSEKIKKRGFMTYDLFKKIIDETSGFVHSVTLHHRGEPLLHNDLPKMIRYCNRHGVFTQIHSNGTLLTQKKSHAIIESGLDLISFSIDGYDKKSYEEIRIGANFEKTIENIKIFMKIRKGLRSKKPKMLLEVIDFFQNDPEKITRIREQVKDIHADQLIIKKPHNWAGSFPVDEGGYKAGHRSRWPDCTFPWYALTILWDGTVVACPQDFYGETAIGNLRKNTLKDLWNHPLQVHLRDKMKMKHINMSPCRSCDRIGRKHIFGIPTTPLNAFLKEIL